MKQDPFAAARRLKANGIHVEKRLASHDFCAQAREQGLDIFVWTVNEVREMAAFAAMGVQGLISDYPERFAHWTFH